MKRLFPFLIILFFIAVSCKKDKLADPVDLAYGYMPTNTGHWVVYDVDSTAYDNFTKIQTHYQYQLKEVIVSSYLDNQGRITQRIERFRRYSDTANWQIIDVWNSNRTSLTYEKVEENIRFVKLSFPVKQGLKWNGNAYNENEQQDYKYDKVDQPFTVNGIRLDSTLTVIQQKYISTQVSGDSASEIYAKKIGMVYKTFYLLSKSSLLTTSTLQYISYTYKLNAYGNQ